MALGQGPKPFEESGPGPNHPLECLDDDAGERIVVFLDDRGDRVQIVVRRDQHFSPDGVRNAGRVRNRLDAVAAPPGRQTHQRIVVHAVIAALELQDFRPSAECAHRPHRVERRLRAAAREAHLLGAWHRFANRFGQQDSGAAVGEEGGAPFELLAHRRNHLRMPVTDEHRAGAEQEVDVLLARRIAHSAAGAFDDHEVGAGVSETPPRQECPGLLAQCDIRMDLLFHARSPVRPTSAIVSQTAGRMIKPVVDSKRHQLHQVPRFAHFGGLDCRSRHTSLDLIGLHLISHGFLMPRGALWCHGTRRTRFAR